jgi:glycosyltransferase involved in cell wall biosynthesis
MKIAFIGQKGIPATYGGIEKFTEEVAIRLSNLGHEVTVYTRPHYLKTSEKDFNTELKWLSPNALTYNGVLIKRIPSIPTKHLDTFSHTFLCTCDALLGDYDAIIYQAIGPSSLSVIPRLFSKSLVISIIHSLDWKRKKWGHLARILLRIAECFSIYSPKRVFVISDTLRQYFASRYRRKTTVLTPGIEIDQQIDIHLIEKLGLIPHEYILFLNRIVPEKGCHYFLEALAKIKTDKKVVIAGDNTQEPRYFERLKQRFSNDQILFLGYVEKKVKCALYANAFLYVLPSEIEGLPQTLLEAAAYGCPVLASDIPENLKVLGENGFYFRRGDAEDLANKLEYLLKNPETLTSHVAFLKDLIKQTYSWGRTCSALLEGIANA